MKDYQTYQKRENYQCQKCLNIGHYSYECKKQQSYLYRPSLMNQVKNQVINTTNKSETDEDMPSYTPNYGKWKPQKRFHKVKNQEYSQPKKRCVNIQHSKKNKDESISKKSNSVNSKKSEIESISSLSDDSLKRKKKIKKYQQLTLELSF